MLLRLAAGVITHPQPLGQLRPDVPRSLAAIIERMMALDPEQRYQDAREIAGVLQDWLLEVSPPPLREPSRHLVPPVPVQHAIDQEPLLPEVEGFRARQAGPSPWAVAACVAGLAFLGFMVFRWR